MGVGSEAVAVFVVALLTVKAAAVSILCLDLAWPLAAAWLLCGIARMHSQTMVATASVGGAVITVIAGQVGFVMAICMIGQGGSWIGGRPEDGACQLPVAAPYIDTRQPAAFRGVMP